MSGERERDRTGAREEDFSPSDEERDFLRCPPFSTDEGNHRDHSITRLLRLYVDAYEDKMTRNRGYRETILNTCVILIVGMVLVVALLPFQVLEEGSGLEMADVVSYVTAIGALVGLIAGMLHVVTEYAFPKEDEKYITEIVRAIQENDLKNREVTAKYKYPDDGGLEPMDEDPLEAGRES